MQTWNIIDATDHLDELILNAIEHRPQRVEMFGLGAVVVMNAEDYARLVSPNLIGFMQASPAAKEIEEDGIDFELDRPREDLPRDFDLD